MSIPSGNPPPNNPPPGNYYAAPPPPAKPGSGGCWKVGGIGCALLLVLAIIGGVVAVRSVKDQIAHPVKGSFLGTAVSAGKAGMDGALIQKAIVNYHTEKGKYPASLMVLVEDGSLDGKRLHNDLDDSPDPAHQSWRYFPPKEGDPVTTPILEEPYHVTVGNKTQLGRITILLNGKSGSSSSIGQ